MLDIIQANLVYKFKTKFNGQYKFLRLDGKTPGDKRQALVDKFNSDPSISVFLISTRAGGLGLNLTSASKVIITDFNFNPTIDMQAQDRAYRMGQKRHVEVYRLCAKGTIEEAIYLRQLYKQSLESRVLGGLGGGGTGAVVDAAASGGGQRGKGTERLFVGVRDVSWCKGELFGMYNLMIHRTTSLVASLKAAYGAPLPAVVFASPTGDGQLSRDRKQRVEAKKAVLELVTDADVVGLLHQDVAAGDDAVLAAGLLVPIAAAAGDDDDAGAAGAAGEWGNGGGGKKKGGRRRREAHGGSSSSSSSSGDGGDTASKKPRAEGPEKPLGADALLKRLGVATGDAVRHHDNFQTPGERERAYDQERRKIETDPDPQRAHREGLFNLIPDSQAW